MNKTIEIPSPTIESSDYAVITEYDGFYKIQLVANYTTTGTIRDEAGHECQYTNIIDAIDDVKNMGITEIRLTKQP